MVRKEGETPPNAKTPLIIKGYSTGQTSGCAHSSSPERAIRESLRSSLQADQPLGFEITLMAPQMPKAISPPKEIASQHLTPFGIPSKYQGPKTGEAALPTELVRRNMHADRWQEPVGFNVHIAHNNGNNKGNRWRRRNNARIPEQIQESDDEEEVGQAPPAGVEPAPRIHPEMDIRNEMEVLRQLIYNGKAG
ncbi:zinc finger X-linked ZXDB, partial [Prunus dulcis]